MFERNATDSIKLIWLKGDVANFIIEIEHELGKPIAIRDRILVRFVSYQFLRIALIKISDAKSTDANTQFYIG